MWACPPLAVVQTAVHSFIEMRVRGTVVVPEWEAQAWYVFQSMQRSSRWGKAAGAAGYTVELYASPLAKQCTRCCSRGAEAESAGGEPGCLGDARLVKLANNDNVWACPPLAVVQTAVRSFIEM